MSASRRRMSSPIRGAPRRARADHAIGETRADAAGDEQIAIDFLQLVRSACAAPTIRSSSTVLTVVDALLKVDTPKGPVWHRYNGDGYGEHDDGRPFDGTGRGRGWPLLTGERGHYELCARRRPAALPAGDGGDDRARAG